MTTQQYSADDIAADRHFASRWSITVPGWYAFDGPEGDELVSGPFESKAVAESDYIRWREL